MRLDQRGNTVILATFFCAMVALGLTQLFSSLSRESKTAWKMETDTDREMLARILYDSIDCASTLNPGSLPSPLTVPPPGCTATTTLPSGTVSINLKRRAGGAIADANGRILGWEIRGYCSGTGLEFTAASYRHGSLEADMSLSNTLLDHNHPQAQVQLGRKKLSLCDTYFGAVSTPVTGMRVGSEALGQTECTAGWNATMQTCNNVLTKYVSFPAGSFSSPPKVVVFPQEMPRTTTVCLDYGNTFALASSVTATGFTLTCAAQPGVHAGDNGSLAFPRNNCTSYSNRFIPASCAWIAMSQ